MLGKARSFSSFAVPDTAAAKAFYGEKLGVDVSEEEGGLLSLHLGDGANVMVYPKPDYTPATYTVLNFPVDDIDAAVDELSGKGVTFERYEGMPADEKGIVRDFPGPQIAWFKDPAGNILSVLQEN